MKSYSGKVIAGATWMGAFRIFSRMIAFVRVIILARLLVPAQLGVFGIASISLALLEILTETGINVFLVQEKDKLDNYVNDAWLVSIIRGILIAVSIILAAPLIITFFKIPQALDLVLLISIVPFIRGFINPAEVKFQKNLQFGKEFYFRTAIFSLDSLIAVVVSLITRSAIGLVFGLIAGAIFEVALSFILIRPIPALKFDLRKISKIFHRGKWVTLYGILNYMASKGDNIVIGRLIGAGALGIYQMGYALAALPVSEIADVSNRVTFPVYSIISGDRKRLIKGFKKAMLLVSAASILIGIAIFFFPKDLFIFIFGQKWESTMTILKPLAIFGIIRAISGTTSAFFLGVEKQNYVAGMTSIRLLILIITIIPLTVGYGIVGASYAVLLSGISEIPIIIYYIKLTFKAIK